MPKYFYSFLSAKRYTIWVRTFLTKLLCGTTTYTVKHRIYIYADKKFRTKTLESKKCTNLDKQYIMYSYLTTKQQLVQLRKERVRRSQCK